MDEWNVFSDSPDPELEHKLGEPIKVEKLCECGDQIAGHDRLGCMSRGCPCKKTLHELTYREKKA